MPPTPATARPAVTAADLDQVRAYHRDGYLPPMQVIPPDQVAAWCAAVESGVLGTDGPSPGNRLTARHMDVPVVHRIARAAPVVDILRLLLGDDLVMWNSYLWHKAAGDPAVPWHQDIGYWPLEPWLNVSLWIALERVDTGNACVQVIPGSHRRIIPLVPSHGTLLAQESSPDQVDTSAAIPMALEPGQGFLFNERILHASDPNPGPRRRFGMSLRYTTPRTRILHDEPPLFPGHAALLIAGEDRLGLNRYVNSGD